MIMLEMAERMNLVATDHSGPEPASVVAASGGFDVMVVGLVDVATTPRLKTAPHSDDLKSTAPKRPRRLPVLSVAAKLSTQRTLTAVERFARNHERGEAPAQAKYYRSLLPQSKPKPGEQLAFEVDLDRCTGCKACVSACHSLNGLDESEMWRSVGLIQSKTAEPSRVQTVTSSCHHCVEPACLKGCPVGAYEKDEVTGIVKHLDDQCFGCQYCTLMCPYDAPQFSPERGIVRKCDMCSQRLEVGEAPACVQACPNEAIRISIVSKSEATGLAEAGQFLEGAPNPGATQPTTRYRSSRGLPPGLAAADEGRLRVEHAHLPLVVMLTLTQLGVGTLAFARVTGFAAHTNASQALVLPLAAFAWTAIALVASIFHLGRPKLAFRAVLNIKTSWLSREALGFGLFAKVLGIYLVSIVPPAIAKFPLQKQLAVFSDTLGTAAVALGVLGVFCSVMVYVATRREHWSWSRTGLKFFGSTAILGLASGVALISAMEGNEARPGTNTLQAIGLLALVLVGCGKLLWERRRLLAANSPTVGNDSLVAQVMLVHLKSYVYSRFALGFMGVVVLPLLILCAALPLSWVPLATLAMLLAVLSGELLERAMFFKAAPGSRMPGGAP